MPRDTLTVTDITEAGVAAPAQVTGVAANDLQFAAAIGEIVFIEVENEDASPHTVEIVTNFTIEELTLPNRQVSVAAGTFKNIAVPLDSRTVFLQDDGNIYINIDTDTYMKFRVYRL